MQRTSIAAYEQAGTAGKRRELFDCRVQAPNRFVSRAVLDLEGEGLFAGTVSNNRSKPMLFQQPVGQCSETRSWPKLCRPTTAGVQYCKARLITDRSFDQVFVIDGDVNREFVAIR